MLINARLYQKIKSAPQAPGIYIFKDLSGQVLYIGKAVNLKKRLLYYTKDESDLFPKTARFLKLAVKVSWIEVKNEIEAILLEVNLIRTLKPKYNIISKDDKRPLFINITKDELPRVKTARVEIPGQGEFIGPFPSSQKLKLIMTKLRHIFPYCSCSTRRKTPCLYADLNLCHPCPINITTQEEKQQYRRHIRHLKLFLRGQIKAVINQLKKEMLIYSQKQAFEQAQEIKNQILAINELLSQDHKISQYLTNNQIKGQLRASQNLALTHFLNLKNIKRIEGFDIANTQGQQATASMVVFEHGLPNTSEYKRFRIKNICQPNDPLMMSQVISRRIKHNEWPLPDLILIDGGKTQVAAVLKVLDNQSFPSQIIGLAKKQEQLVLLVNGKLTVATPPLDSPYLTLLRAVRDEAHCFSTTYHKQLRQKNMLAKLSQ